MGYGMGPYRDGIPGGDEPAKVPGRRARWRRLLCLFGWHTGPVHRTVIEVPLSWDHPAEPHGSIILRVMCACGATRRKELL